MTPDSADSADALARDAADPLAVFADQFHHPFDSAGRRSIYLCGHSLGLQPKTAAQYVEQELKDWQRLGVLGHHTAERPWIKYHEHAAATLSALVGAHPVEVVAMNSLTVNLHLMMVSFFRPDGERNRLLIEKSAFPSDRYAVVSQLNFHGLTEAQHLIEVEPRPGERALRTEDVIRRIEQEGNKLAMVLLPSVQYLTGQTLDLKLLTAAARRAAGRTSAGTPASVACAPGAATRAGRCAPGWASATAASAPRPDRAAPANKLPPFATNQSLFHSPPRIINTSTTGHWFASTPP